MCKVIKIKDIKPAISYLTEVLDKIDSMPLQLRISKVISKLSDMFNGSAPIGLVVDSYKRKYGETSKLELKLKEFWETETEYDGPLLAIEDVNRMPEITVDNLTTIDFLIKDW